MFWKKSAQIGAITRSEAITSDPGAHEILSIWLSSGGNNIVLVKPDTWSDPAAWGLLLADISRHIANALAASTKADPKQTIARIKVGYDVELASPTDTPTGSWQ